MKWIIQIVDDGSQSSRSWYLQKPLGLNLKRLQETEKSQVAYDTALRNNKDYGTLCKTLFFLPSDIPNSWIQPTGWGLTRTPDVSKQLPFWTESRPLWRTVCTMQHSWLLTAVCNQSSGTAVAKNTSPSSCDAPVTWSRCFSQAVTQALSLRPLLLEQSGGDNATFSEGSLAYV